MMAEEENTEDVKDSSNLLVSIDDYLSNGVHVGLKYKTADMRPFIYKIRPDKLCVFDIQKIDERIRIAAKFIASYAPGDVLVVSNRVYGRKPIEMFYKYTGCRSFIDRFVSGTLTNPNIKSYMEPKILIVTDPTADQQAVKEASDVGISIIGICDSNTRLKKIDYCIPSNNKGKNALALIYWILAREVLKERGVKEAFEGRLEEFISEAEPQPYMLELQEMQRQRRSKMRRRGGGRRRS
ncbi:MAG: 30S ribosomal protein S2 [Candidatus Altiarchaeota archaeon]